MKRLYHEIKGQRLGPRSGPRSGLRSKNQILDLKLETRIRKWAIDK